MLVMVVVRRLSVGGGLTDLAVLVWGLGALALRIVAAFRRARGRTGEAGGEPAPAAAAD